MTRIDSQDTISYKLPIKTLSVYCTISEILAFYSARDCL